VKVKESFPPDKVAVTKYTVVSGFIFLRFFNPAILGPKLFYLMDIHPDVKVNRSLILLSKTLQNLANLAEFSGKEDFMLSMNEFVLYNMENLKTFIDELSTCPEANYTPTVSPPVVFEKEMASIYRHIKSGFTAMSQKANSEKERNAIQRLENCILELEEAENNFKQKYN